ncbi:hypothetical protein [Thermus sp. NEB1569]|uniref:hypothetical protein n=1 Tax=Thermus sp. NEB1569 TaxID=2918899 RepID=UPI001EFB02A1|nr:hypothetical protein [Thermus sp. NEB1569]ULR39748.1 hypothetical protein MI302_00300 [Thermus sp. NEB1569]
MLPETFREYAKSKGLGREYLENLAGFFLVVAKENGEEEEVSLLLGEDPALGPYLDVDLRRAPKTHAWLSAFREAAQEGATVVVQKRAVRAVVVPAKKGQA